MTPIVDYFQDPSLYQRALTRYAEVASGRGWGIEHKLEMYNHAKAAFDPKLSYLTEAQRHGSFGKIYKHLRGGWKVFRGVPAGSYWTENQTYEALTREGSALSRQQSQTLLRLRPGSQESGDILAELTLLRDLKQTRWYPWMPVSKFTHFLNPKLFPIYDTEVIWNQVLDGAFRDDYRRWCAQIRVAPLETDTESGQFNLTYTLMAGNILRQADDGFMDFFAQWFRDQVEGQTDEHDVIEDVHQYYATAFEFIAIGAASL